MSAPGNDEGYYSLREAVCSGDLATAESLLESDAGGVSNAEHREEILTYCFGSAENANATDEEKAQMWSVVSSAWSDTVRASASKLLQSAINLAPLEIFEELLQLVEESLEPTERQSVLFGCEGCALTPTHESKRKAAYDRAVAESKQGEGSAVKGKGKK